MASGSIRYNYEKQVWEFSNDRTTYKEFSAKDHTHASMDIADATANAINNKIVRRGPSAEASFGRVQVDTAIYGGTYARMGRANSVIDSELTTVTNFSITGTTSNFKTTVQDGGGKVNMLWNATKAANGKYLVGNEAALRLNMDSTASGGLFTMQAAAPGLGGADILWTEYFAITNGELTLGPLNRAENTAPHFTVSTKGDVTALGTMYAKGFETASERRLKEDIKETQKDALAILNAITVFEYKYRDDIDKIPRIGIMADDVDDDYLTGPEGTYFDISNTVGYLVKAVQQLTDRIARLEQRVKYV